MPWGLQPPPPTVAGAAHRGAARALAARPPAVRLAHLLACRLCQAAAPVRGRGRVRVRSRVRGRVRGRVRDRVTGRVRVRVRFKVA